MDRGERVEKFPLFRGRVADSVGGEQRKLHRTRQLDHGLIASFLVAMKMALKFGIDVLGSKNPDEFFEARARGKAFSCQTNQTLRA